MRRVLLLSYILLLGLDNAGWTHGDEAVELGHHWEIPAYAGEIHAQLVIMAVLVAVIAGASFIARSRRKAADR